MSRVLPQPVIAERYAHALGDADPIESQRKAPKRVRKLIKGLSNKQLAARPEDGKWSIKEVIAHLADGEMILGSRLRYVAAMDRPAIVGYDQDAFVRNLRYDDLEVDELIEAFAALRAFNCALLDRLPDDAFARVGLHSERGEESLSTMVHLYAGHDRIHEQQIERLRDAVLARKAAKKQREREAAAAEKKRSKRRKKK